MKKLLLLLTSVISLSLFSNAQKGNNQIGVAFEAGLPTGDFGTFFNTGYGGTLKGLLGVGTTGQVTFTSGYVSFKEKGSTSGNEASINIIPVLLGFRDNLNGLYIEPQLGYGSYSSKFTENGMSGSDSQGAFTWAIGLGYQVSGFEMGVRYQSGKLPDATSSIGYVGIHVGYNFSLNGKSK